jgi:hypothetical protein
MNIRTAEMKLIFSSSIVVSPPYELNYLDFGEVEDSYFTG